MCAGSVPGSFGTPPSPSSPPIVKLPAGTHTSFVCGIAVVSHASATHRPYESVESGCFMHVFTPSPVEVLQNFVSPSAVHGSAPASALASSPASPPSVVAPSPLPPASPTLASPSALVNPSPHAAAPHASAHGRTPHLKRT